MRKNVAAPNVYIIFIITLIIFFIVLISSMGRQYVSGRLINTQKTPLSMIKICMADKNSTSCTISNRYGKFIIQNTTVSSNETVRLIIRDNFTINEIKITIPEKKTSGLNTIYELEDIIINFSTKE